MQILSSRAALFMMLSAFILTTYLPLSVDAQYDGRRRSSSYSSKISKLDDDKVEKLSIPILFGITVWILTPNFGDARGDGTRTHEGLDIMAPDGAPIVSPTEAVVIQTGTGTNSGNYVTTANPGGETFVYMHLSEIIAKRGDELDEGDLIGYVGNTGNASGGATHLHLEIRDGRTATDPFPRLVQVFSAKDKINFLKNALEELNDDDDREDFVKFVTKNYATELRQAAIAGIELPDEILEALKTAAISTPVYVPPVVPYTPLPTPTQAGAIPVADLELGAQGSDVTTLQTFLITKNTGSSAIALAGAGATGYFGTITQSALIEYQLAHGITPAVGYYGPKTRAYISANPN